MPVQTLNDRRELSRPAATRRLPPAALHGPAGVRREALRLALTLVLAIVVAIPALKGAAVPSTKRHPVVRVYQGQRVKDDYEWLEEGTNAEVRSWTAAQNEHARAWLDAREARPLVEARLRELFSKTSPNYSSFTSRAGRLFFVKFQPPAQ